MVTLPRLTKQVRRRIAQRNRHGELAVGHSKITLKQIGIFFNSGCDVPFRLRTVKQNGASPTPRTARPAKLGSENRQVLQTAVRRVRHDRLIDVSPILPAYKGVADGAVRDGRTLTGIGRFGDR